MSLEVNIEKRLGKFNLRVNFTTEGSRTAILGASGCGKSMTLRCISGIEKPDKGRIVLNGKVLFDSEKKINLPPQQRKVGHLFQNYALFQNMTVEQNIACGIREKMDSASKKAAVAEMIRMMQLEGKEHHRPAQLSGGQQQRVALARILVGRPEILMLDEPFSALDSYLRDQLITEVRKMLESYDKDVLMVTHSRDEAYTLCPELMIMDDGKISRKGRTKQVFADPATVPAAILTGCKNIYPARKAGETTVEVPQLGLVFETGRQVGENLCAVGIRAHYFNTTAKTNMFDVELMEESESPFEWTIKFRYRSQDPASQPVWWRVNKEKKLQVFPEKLGIAPLNILLLYED